MPELFAVFVFVLPVIAAPDAPQMQGWWPLPPGWWLLGLALFLGMLWMAYLFLRRFIRAGKAREGRTLPVRTRAMAALDELEHREPLDAREVAYRLKEILRESLADSPVSMDDQVQWQHFWQELEMRYRPSMAAGDMDITRWIAQARAWVAQLPVDDAGHGKGMRR